MLFRSVVDGDRIKYGTGSSSFNYVNATSRVSLGYGLLGGKIQQYTDTALLTPATTTFADLNLSYKDTTLYTVAGKNALAVYSSQAKNISEDIKIESPGLYGGGKNFKLTVANSSKIEVGDYLVDSTGTYLTRVTVKVRKIDASTGVPYFEYTVVVTPKTTTTSGLKYVTRYQAIQKIGRAHV